MEGKIERDFSQNYSYKGSSHLAKHKDIYCEVNLQMKHFHFKEESVRGRRKGIPFLLNVFLSIFSKYWKD
jgi:hypothetical protein